MVAESDSAYLYQVSYDWGSLARSMRREAATPCSCWLQVEALSKCSTLGASAASFNTAIHPACACGHPSMLWQQIRSKCVVQVADQGHC